MAGFVNLKVSGQQKFLRHVGKVPKRLSNKRGMHLSAVITYERWIKKNFRAEGKNHENGKFKWKPLKESTVERRRKGKGKGQPKILRDTGNLMLRWDRVATNTYGWLRSGVSYSSIHENGDRRRGIPQRKILPSDKQGRKIIKPVFEKFLKEAVE